MIQRFPRSPFEQRCAASDQARRHPFHHPGAAQVRRLVLTFWLFQPEEVEVAVLVRGDELGISDEGTASSFGIQRKREDQCSCLHIPHLQRLVLGGGDEPPGPAYCEPKTAVWPSRLWSSRPVSTSHTFSLLFLNAETARCPSLLIATLTTGLGLGNTQFPDVSGRFHSRRMVATPGSRGSSSCEYSDFSFVVWLRAHPSVTTTAKLSARTRSTASAIPEPR
jgi:hypothetical protein